MKFGPVMQEVVTAMSEKRFLILPHAEVLPAEEPFSWRVVGRSEMEFLLFFGGGLPSFFLGDRGGGVRFAKKMRVEFVERALTTPILIAFWGASNDEKRSPFCL